MSFFKYTVANKDGKKLSGTVESPDIISARSELNSLGFSVLDLEEKIEDLSKKDESKTNKFVFEAVDKRGKLITGTIPENEKEEAFNTLRKKYDLTVTAIWNEGASPTKIAEARTEGTQKLQQIIIEENEKEGENKVKSLEEQKFAEISKLKIEKILKSVNDILVELEKDIDPDQKAEINKKLDKLLRIKNSQNTNYILGTAEDLLNFLQLQEKSLKEKGLQDKRLFLQLKTQNLLNEIKSKNSSKSLSEDIEDRIDSFKYAHPNYTTINKFLDKIKNIFKVPTEIRQLEAEITSYNKQLWDFSIIWLKEPTPEYKEKIKQSIKAVWEARKRAKENIKKIKKFYKEQHLRETARLQGIDIKDLIDFDGTFTGRFTEELNSLTGWLLVFYLGYYFISLYITTKDFGLLSLSDIPKNFFIYESQTFKYILGVIFLLHASTSLKVNFLKNSFIGSLALTVFFISGTIVVLLNF